MSQYDNLSAILYGSGGAQRRKCFVSYHHADQGAVDTFVSRFENVFIAKAIGVSDIDDYICSDSPEYVMSCIRRKVLEDSTVTICLIGECTHSRRYVDWELKASLRQGEGYSPNGLLGILLPHMGSQGHLPSRFRENWDRDEQKSFATYRRYPTGGDELKRWIEEAYGRRTTHARHISNSRDMMSYNAKCLTHGVTH